MAEILKIPFKNIERIELIGGKKAKTLKNAVSHFDRKPDYVFNATHFDNSTTSKTYGVTISDTIVNSKWVNGGNYNTKIYTDEGIAFNNDGKMVFTTSMEAENGNWESYIGGSPHIVKNGKVCNEEFDTCFENSKVLRMAMGFNANELIVGFPKSKKTITQLATYMKEQGSEFAIALDGGGSVNVCQYMNGSYRHLDEHKNNRAVSTFVCVWLKKKESVEETQTKPSVKKEVPVYNGLNAIGIYEIVWTSVNRRAGNGLNYALAGTPLKKGDRITVFKKEGTWLYSYGYWVSENATRLVEKY